MRRALVVVLAAVLAGGAVPALADPVDDAIAATDKLQREGKVKESLAPAKLALELADKSGDELLRAKALINYSGTLVELGDLAPAVEPMREAMEIRQRRLAPTDPLTLDSISQYAGVLTFIGRDGEAEPLLVRAADGLEQVARTPAEKVTAGETRGGHAMTLLNLGRWVEGEAEMKRALAMLSDPSLPTSPALPAFMSVLSNAYLSWGRYQDARAQAQATLEFRVKYQGPDHPEVAGTMSSLAKAELALGDNTSAEQHFRRQLAIAEAGYPPDSRYRAQAVQNLASFYAATNRPDEAYALYQKAIDAFGRGGAVSWPEALAFNNYAQARLRNGDAAGARDLAARSVEMYDKTLGPKNEATGFAHVVLAQALVRLGDLDAAETEAKTALVIYEAALTPENPRRGDVLALLGRVADARGRGPEAAALYAQALDAMVKARPAQSPAVMEARRLLARRLIATDTHKAMAMVSPAADALRDKLIADSRLLGRGGEGAPSEDERQVFLTAIDAAWAASAP